jgi:aryl-alcohol dehydrogenase-like predicted oxidoreductase
MVRDLEREHVPLCRELGLGILPWSPLAAGFLTGKISKDKAPPAGTRLDKFKDRFAGFDNPRGWRVLDALRVVAAEKQAPPSAVALAWLIHKPQVTSVILGARTVEQLDDNLKGATVKLSAEDLKRLDDASAFEVGYPYDFMLRIQSRW